MDTLEKCIKKGVHESLEVDWNIHFENWELCRIDLSGMVVQKLI